HTGREDLPAARTRAPERHRRPTAGGPVRRAPATPSTRSAGRPGRRPAGVADSSVDAPAPDTGNRRMGVRTDLALEPSHWWSEAERSHQPRNESPRFAQGTRGRSGADHRPSPVRPRSGGRPDGPWSGSSTPDTATPPGGRPTG